jgi:hypothetical protein
MLVLITSGNLIPWETTMAYEPASVTLSVSGLPPSYIERRQQIEIPAQQREEFDTLLARAHFFDLPANLGGNPENGRDMGTYSISVTIGTRSHTVEFSDSSITQELANLKTWLHKLP